jgi:hypothetical protein
MAWRCAQTISYQTQLVATLRAKALKTCGWLAYKPATVDGHPSVVESKLRAEPAIQQAEEALKKISPLVSELWSLLAPYEV